MAFGFGVLGGVLGFETGSVIMTVLSVGIAMRDVMPEGGTLTLRAHSSQSALTIGAHAVGQAGADKHTAAQPIELGFVESLVRRSGGELILSRSELGTCIEIVLPRAAG